jgi:thymidine kinase
MDGAINKPYRFEEIYSNLEQHLGLRFHYGDVDSNQLVPIIDKKRLAKLPEAVLNELQSALESLESGAIDAVIQKVDEYDSELAGNLSRIAESLDYQVILNALQEAQS